MPTASRVTQPHPEKPESEAQCRSFLDALLHERDVARITGLSVASVRRWRLLRQGPRFMKLGSAVRYRPEDVSAWLNSRPTGGEPTAPAQFTEGRDREPRLPLQRKPVR
jgi:predicted DNA-binding transcriptional regulator AlpA